MLNESNYPYGLSNRFNSHNRISEDFLKACLFAGDSALAKKVGDAIKKDLKQQLAYYQSLSGSKAEYMQMEAYMAEELLNRVEQLDKPASNRIEIPGKLMKPADSVNK